MLTGCSKFGPTDKTKGELTTQVNTHTGNTGLKIDFVTGQPSTYVWEKSQFPITVKLQNMGAYDIVNGFLTITGNLYFGLTPYIPFNLAGKSQFNPEGEFSFQQFSATAAEVDEDKTDTFFVIACYPYKTYASAPICINLRNEDVENIPKEECKVGSISLSSGQGAPVAITSIDEQIIPLNNDISTLTLKIHVANKGGGKVVAYNAYAKDCEGNALSEGELGKITVKDMRFSNYILGGETPITCQNLKDNSFNLDETGQFIIDCSVKLDKVSAGSVAFTTPLTIELNYGYSQISQSKTITIRNAP